MGNAKLISPFLRLYLGTEVFSFFFCSGDNYYGGFLFKDRQTDRQIDGRTDRKIDGNKGRKE